MSDTPNPPPPSQPSPIEVMGALCSLLIHDFANHLSVINGNAQCAQMFVEEPQRTTPALVSILRAGETAAGLLTKCGELRRSLGTAFLPGDLSLLQGLVAEAVARCSGWTVSLPAPLAGRVSLPLYWITFAVTEFVKETKENRGTVWLALKTAPGKSGDLTLATPGLIGGQLLEVRLVWRSSRPFPLDEIRSKHLNMNLLAACELIKLVGGRPVCATIWPTEQEITVCIPAPVRDDRNFIGIDRPPLAT